MSKKTSEKENNEKLEEKAPETAEQSNETAEQSNEKTKKSKKLPRDSRKIKHGIWSAAFTILFIAVVVVLNVIVSIVSDSVNTAADLTTAGIYSLDEKTENYLQNELKHDVTITVLKSEKSFEDQDNSYKQVNEILKKMQMQSHRISLEYLDINQNPNYTAKFKGETLAENYIVIECQDTGRHKIVSPYDYFIFDQSYLQYYGAYVITSSNIEQEAVSAMMYTTHDKPVRVAFTEGYGESENSSALKALLTKNGYDVESLPLNTTPEIDSEIDYVVIYAPSIDMDKVQLAKLDKFLDNNGEFGKNVIYFASTSQPKTPNIDEFLSDWGLNVGYDVVAMTDENYLISADTLYIHLQQLCDTDYTKTVYGSKLYLYGMYLRPVYVLENASVSTSVLMKTHDKAFLYPLDSELAESFKIENAKNGEFNDVVISQKTAENGEKSRVCAAGSEFLTSSLALSYTNSINSEFFVGMWNYISGREQGITINAKSFAPATFEINVKTANILSVILCVGIPVFVIVLGIVIWVRRRHR